eukprot:TRINITY_DN6205_c0_g1_i1.p1 TRINITY_DN6205_c0_g1~~TRINITY_DN6205_c0_g1_i1.p1  ORF type:complete len:257 (+),score=73.72 TRINITY_DN6205_c0_g1_i1:87-773(+)
MAAPPALVLRLQEAEKAFVGNLGADSNAHGQKWKEEKRDGGAVVESSVVPGSSSRCFRASIELQCRKADDCARRIMDLVTDYAKRPEWDKGIASGTVDEQYSGGEEVVSVSTAGSTISPRWWRDCRRRSTTPDGGVHNYTCAWEDGAKAPSGLVKGVNHPGGGSAVVRCPTRAADPDKDCWKVVMVGHSDIGGWVPTAVVNAASSGGYLNTAKQLAKQAEAFGCSVAE